MKRVLNGPRLAIATALALAGVIAWQAEGAPHSASNEVAAAEVSFEDHYAGFDTLELGEILARREDELNRLQEQVALEMIELGLFEETIVEDLEQWTVPTGDSSMKLEERPGFRVSIEDLGGRYLVRTVRVPLGFDADYDALKREVLWLSYRAGS